MKKLIVANWKMQLNPKESLALLNDLSRTNSSYHHLIVCPDFLVLELAHKILSKTNIKLGAQNCAREEKGSLTGEVSPLHLKMIGVDYVIVGHSERRSLLKEDNSLIKAKVKLALASSLKVILCVGENLMEKRAGRTNPVVAAQIRSALSSLKLKRASDLIIAYEPVWAIGRGKAMPEEEVNNTLQYVKKVLARTCDKKIKTLYGGSVNPDNASLILKQKNVDGLLVGGASLKMSSLQELLKKK